MRRSRRSSRATSRTPATKSYAREIANLITTPSGGVEAASVGREANAALLEQVNSSTSQAAYQQALSAGLTTLANTVSDSASTTSSSGADANGNSPSAMLANLQSALETYDASPASTTAGQGVVTAAADLTQSLNAGAAAVQTVRETADTDMASAVSTVNSLLTQFTSVNNTIVAGTAVGADVSAAEDTRDSILTQLSQEIGISTSTNPNGSTSIYTDSGVTLFQDTPRTLKFAATPALPDGAVGNEVTVEGVAITGSFDVRHPIRRAGWPRQFARCRRAAIRRPARPDRQRSRQRLRRERPDRRAAPTLPGLFTFPGATGVPANTATTGLAAEIEVNANVDPSQGGDVNLLRDGEIADPTNSAYTYNTTGAASYTGRIAQLITATTATQSFNGAAGPRDVAGPQRLRQFLGELAAKPEPGGQQPARLPEFPGQPNDDGAVERDRRQPRHRDDQHADHRELLHDDGQTADDRQRRCSRRCSTLCEAMVNSTVSTLSLGTAMLSGVTRAQSQLTQLTTEASSGQYADLGLQLGGQSGYELSLRNQTNLLQSLTTANNLTVTNLKAAQAALELDPQHRRRARSRR